MIQAICLAGEVYYPNYLNKKIVLKQESVFHMAEGWGDAQLSPGTYEIQSQKRSGTELLLFIDGFWLALSDVAKYIQ